MTNKPMLSVDRELLQSALNAVEYLALRGDDVGLSNEPVAKELRALIDKPECSTCKGLGVVDDGELTHSAGGIPYECGPIKCVKDCPDCRKPAARPQAGPVALQHMAVSEGGVLRWMTGRKMQDCELYAMPDGSAIRSKLYAEQPAPSAVTLTDKQILAAMREHIYAADGGYVFDTEKESVVASGRALLEVYRLSEMKP